MGFGWDIVFGLFLRVFGYLVVSIHQKPWVFG